MTGAGTLSSVSLSGNANLTANAGTVSAITFNSAGYAGTTILNSGTTGPATVSVPAGSTGSVTLNSTNAMSGLTVAAGTVTRTGDVSGTTTVSGGSVTQTGNTGSAVVSGSGSYTLTGNTTNLTQTAGSVTVTGNITGTAAISGGTFIPPTTGSINTLQLSGTYTPLTIPAGVTINYANVTTGAVNLNGPVTTLDGGGTINLGATASVANANLRSGTANTQGNAIPISSQLLTSGSTFTWTPGAGAAFTVKSANITDDSTPRTITLTGGTLATPPIGGGMGVHWAGYGVNNVTTAPSGDGAPGYELTTWNNVGTNLGMGLAGNLLDSVGRTTKVAARLGTGGGNNDGPYGSYGTGSSEPLLDGSGGYAPLATQITGINYVAYKIVLYVNTFGNANGSAWVGGTTAGGGSQTYYFQTTGTSNTFAESTSTSNSSYQTGNYVVFDGLSGANQLLYVANVAYFVNPPANTSNWESYSGGFEIINATSPDTYVPQTAISATATSTMDFTAPGGAVTLGDVSVSNAGTALTVKSAGPLTLGNTVLNAGTALNVGANTANHGLVRLHSLAVDPTGSVDLSNHDLYVPGGAASLASLLTASGSLVKTSSTLGTLGVLPNASAPPASATLAIALLTGSEYMALGKTDNLLDGVTVTSGDLVGVLAYAGDANLDGKITVDDYMALNLGYLFGLKGWTHGDFAQTGTITVDDYAILDNNYLHQSGSVAEGEIAIHTQWFGAAYTDAFNALNVPAAVPEPASLGLLACGALGLLRRKGRK